DARGAGEPRWADAKARRLRAPAGGGGVVDGPGHLPRRDARRRACARRGADASSGVRWHGPPVRKTLGRRMRYGAIVAVVAMLSGVAVESAHAAGVLMGKFGDVTFKARRRIVVCNYSRLNGIFIVSGVQVIKRGRIQRGATAAGTGPDPSAPGTV